MFKKLKKKFTKTKAEGVGGDPRESPPENASTGGLDFDFGAGTSQPVATTARTGSVRQDNNNNNNGSTSTSTSTTASSKISLSDRLKKISISSDRVVRPGSQKSKKKVLLDPFAASSNAGTTSAAASSSVWEDFGSPAGDVAATSPQAAAAAVVDKPLDVTAREEEAGPAAERPPPQQFVSPIEEARRKWQEANALRPPSFRSEIVEPQSPGSQVSGTSSVGMDTSPAVTFTKDDDGWSEEPNSPLLLKTTSRTFSNTSVNRPANQSLYQVVHDFMADGEEELTVWAGDVVDVISEDDGWYLAKVFNEDGTFEQGLIPASYCIEWNEAEGNYPSPRISPRNSLRAAETYALETVQREDFVPPEEFLEMAETVNAEFCGNKLAKFGVAGEIKASDPLITRNAGKPLDFAVVPSAAAATNPDDGGEEDEMFQGAQFSLHDALSEDRVKCVREKNVLALGFKEIPQSFSGEATPLVRYKLQKDLCKVPLVMQLTWCRRSLSLDNKRKELVVSICLAPSPFLGQPLDNFHVTLQGIPQLKLRGKGEIARLLSSHPCEVSLKERKLRWNLGNLKRNTALRVVMETDEDGGEGKTRGVHELDDPPLVAHAHFHTPGSVSGFALGGLGDRQERLYKSVFKSGSYSCTPDYEVTDLP
ncbi:hypothetical protein A3770_06p40850 [Chloropicon primus]|uniref:SH3 domain-containing protein n=2 Tax=Chloropicon primus TaxID=1764295 RepID=A0A5B8MM91_9CHLO|nr:hypothetical protein A3770_06p40850 [Chloropicon primus]|eukprot:QDZ21567.1 hypothetical protein A3770_06p40850 [Chloropicon primus]